MKFLDIVLEKGIENWTERNKEAFEELFGGSGGRYPAKAKKMVRLRAPEFHGDSGVPFSALIHPSNPDSGAFGGMSIVIFPVSDAQCLIAMGVGTQGLSPDENVLARPGHARKVAAICAWLNRKYGKKGMIAWAKQDPVRTDLDMPENVKNQFSEYASVFKRYGKEIYGFCAPLDNAEAAEDALKAFMDLNFEERGEQPLTAFKDDCEKIRLEYYSHLLPDVNSEEVSELLTQRRFLVLQGPPGTGKTRMALQILEGHYQGNGITVQFHPGMTYENFVGGLAPVSSEEGFGFKFAPQKGFLMQAAEAAQKSSKPFLLMIDEINRADLSKVLGEAIFLFEDKSDQKRKVKMPYDFGEPFFKQFSLPDNLHVLGTMNSADRSIAIVDIAVRRRFAFLSLWPQMKVVEDHGCEIMKKAFSNLVSIFVEHAVEDAFVLMPGHSYFLEKDEKKAPKHLMVNLVPLLQEYLAQGYVASFSDSVRSYLQWIESIQ